jgi:hypothetical protein
MILTVEQVERILAWTPDDAKAIQIVESDALNGTVTASWRTSEYSTGRVLREADITRDGTPYELTEGPRL